MVLFDWLTLVGMVVAEQVMWASPPSFTDREDELRLTRGRESTAMEAFLLCVCLLGRVYVHVTVPVRWHTAESVLRDWSLITGRGRGLQNGRGGAREVLPLRKGGAEKVLAILKGGHKRFWGSFYVVA